MFNVNFPSERFIEDYITHQLESTGLCPIDLIEVDNFVRQHEIKGYGRTDLIKFRKSPGLLEVIIVELKNEPITEMHLSQLARYMVGARRQAARYQRRFPGYEINVRGQLAGPFDPSIGDFVWLMDVIEGIEVYSLSVCMSDGFRSEEITSGWHKKGEDLKGAKPIAKLIGQDVITFEKAVLAFEAQGRLEEAE